MPVPEPARVTAALDLLRPVVGADASRVLYRLLYVVLARQRGVEVPTAAVLDGLPPLDRRTSQSALAALRDGAPVSTEDVGALGDLHQALLPATARRRAGAYYTPQPLVEHLLDEALEPALDEGDPARVTVLDPACGTGLFLVAAARRIARRGVPLDRALQLVHGLDLDGDALELARVSLWLTALDHGGPPVPSTPHLHAVDALVDADRCLRVDVVVGNPPFLNRLERRTAPDPAVARRLSAEAPGVVRAYTDVSAVFLHRATSWVHPGGRVALVQPQSLLAARDAAGVRAEVAATCSLESLWAADRPVFDAGVLTCAPVLRRGGEQGKVRRHHGLACEELPPVDAGDLRGTWSHLLAGALGLPAVALRRPASPPARVGDVAACTADFRDQYYGLGPYVREVADCPGGAPLVTSGLVDPALNAWGSRATRFLKRHWVAPVVDLDSLRDDKALSRWAGARLVPKVVVAPQGRVVEAVVDERGEWLPSVPTVTVVPRDVSAWHLLAVLLAPPVAVHAATTYAGSGLTMRSIKLSARQVADLPLPLDLEAWESAADAVRLAQHQPQHRRDHLLSAGALMCAAYDVRADDVLSWWADRLR